MEKSNIIIPSDAEILQIAGEVIHKVNGEIVHEDHNAINVDLKTYLQSSLDSNIDEAINSLFDTQEITPGNAQDQNDGIVIHDSDTSEWITMVTTSIAANNTHGKRWQGDITSISQARTIDQSALGFDYDEGNPNHFSTVFATQSFTGIPLSSGANYTIEWEIYIQ